MRFLTEDPWERLESPQAAPNILLQMLLRGATASATPTIPTTSSSISFARLHQAASTFSASSTASTGSRTCACRWMRSVEEGKLCERRHLLYRRHARPEQGRSTTSNIMSASRKELEKAGAHIIAVKDMAGLLKPAAAKRAVQGAA
jgi:pyruvate carboxylase